jgi:hypothetical protein
MKNNLCQKRSFQKTAFPKTESKELRHNALLQRASAGKNISKARCCNMPMQIDSAKVILLTKSANVILQTISVSFNNNNGKMKFQFTQTRRKHRFFETDD